VRHLSSMLLICPILILERPLPLDISTLAIDNSGRGVIKVPTTRIKNALEKE
jgi:hypothetical protein